MQIAVLENKYIVSFIIILVPYCVSVVAHLLNSVMSPDSPLQCQFCFSVAFLCSFYSYSDVKL